MEDNKKVNKHRVQMCAAMVALIVGCALVLAGLIIPPRGEIHPTVLVAFGECLTFTGAVLGAKYYADFKAYIHGLMHVDNTHTTSSGSEPGRGGHRESR